MELKLTLRDGTEIPLSEAGYPQHYVISNTTVTEFQEIWNKMTPENVSEITLAEDEFVRKIIGSRLVGTQTATDSDDTITGHFYMTDGTTQTETDEVVDESYTEEEEENMAMIYANQIMLNKKKFSDIKNAVLKEKVRQLLIDLEMEELIDEE